MFSRGAVLFLLTMVLMTGLTIAGALQGPGVGWASYHEDTSLPPNPDPPHVLSGALDVSPAGNHCSGDLVTISGSGATANASVDVQMASDGWQPGNIGVGTPALGTATADAQGNWQLIATIPSSGVVMHPDYLDSPIPAGPYSVFGFWGDGSNSMQASAIIIEEGCGTLEQDVTRTLPSTGLDPGLRLVAVLVWAGILITGLWFSRQPGHQGSGHSG